MTKPKIMLDTIMIYMFTPLILFSLQIKLK